MAIVGRAKYTRARAKFRGDATRGKRRKLILGGPLASCLLEILRARVCVFRPPHNCHRQNYRLLAVYSLLHTGCQLLTRLFALYEKTL